MPDLRESYRAPRKGDTQLSATQMQNLQDALIRQVTGDGGGTNLQKFGNRFIVSQNIIPMFSSLVLKDCLVIQDYYNIVQCANWTYPPGSPLIFDANRVEKIPDNQKFFVARAYHNQPDVWKQADNPPVSNIKALQAGDIIVARRCPTGYKDPDGQPIVWMELPNDGGGGSGTGNLTVERVKKEDLSPEPIIVVNVNELGFCDCNFIVIRDPVPGREHKAVVDFFYPVSDDCDCPEVDSQFMKFAGSNFIVTSILDVTGLLIGAHIGFYYPVSDTFTTVNSISMCFSPKNFWVEELANQCAGVHFFYPVSDSAGGSVSSTALVFDSPQFSVTATGFTAHVKFTPTPDMVWQLTVQDDMTTVVPTQTITFNGDNFIVDQGGINEALVRFFYTVSDDGGGSVDSTALEFSGPEFTVAPGSSPDIAKVTFNSNKLLSVGIEGGPWISGVKKISFRNVRFQVTDLGGGEVLVDTIGYSGAIPIHPITCVNGKISYSTKQCTNGVIGA